MKTILAPVDFSDVSDNAVNYAAAIAKLTNAKLVLMHIYHVPIPPSEAPFLILSMDDLDKENMDMLKKTDERIKQKYGHIETELIISAGFIVDEILTIISDKKIDLVVMGIVGAGKAANMLIGSNTTSLMKKTKAPVLVIPESADFKKVERIVFAYDHKAILPKNILEKIKEFVKIFDAKILVLDVVKTDEVTTLEKAASGVNLVSSLMDVNHGLYFPLADNIEEEIQSFSDRHKADMIVMIPHSHKSLKGLFHRSNTKKMAFHTHIPLLSIHD